MKHLTKIFAVSSLALAATACDVNKTEDGEMPEYDVDTMDVDVKTETKEVEVPVVDVDMPEDDEEDETGN